MALSLRAFGSSASPLSISALYEPLYRARIHAGGLSRNECAHVVRVKRFVQYAFNVRHAHRLKLFYKPCFLLRPAQKQLRLAYGAAARGCAFAGKYIAYAHLLLRPVELRLCYAVLARVLAFFAVKERRLIYGFFFIIVQREALNPTIKPHG